MGGQNKCFIVLPVVTGYSLQYTFVGTERIVSGILSIAIERKTDPGCYLTPMHEGVIDRCRYAKIVQIYKYDYKVTYNESKCEETTVYLSRTNLSNFADILLRARRIIQ